MKKKGCIKHCTERVCAEWTVRYAHQHSM